MLKFQDFRSKAKGLPDLLNYAALADNGIVLQKDGSFLAGWEIKGQDTASSTPEELAFVSLQFSNATRLLGDGYMLHVDASRLTQKAYPDAELSHFPKNAIASQIIDAERRALFGKDVCFTTSTVLCVTYLPNYNATKLAGATQIGLATSSEFEKNIDNFKNNLIELEDALSAVLKLSRLTEYQIANDEHEFMQSDLLSHLQYCLTGELYPMQLPKIPMYLDAILGSYDLVGGIIPRLDNKHLAIIAIDGLPQESWPAMFSSLDSMPFEYRFSTRFIGLDQYSAEKEITMYVKGWNQKVLGFMDQFFNNPNAKVNRDALNMREDAEIAKTEIQSGYMGAGYLTSCIIIMNEDIERLQNNARELRRTIQTLGFGCRIESINALEAWLGSLPGNSYANLRRPLVNTLNLADLLPLSTIWTGNPVCPSPLMPHNAPALSVVMTENETTPFWFNLHFGDIGHTLIFGPTGSGKSTLLALIASQFRRYKNAQVFVFDKGMSMFPLCLGDSGDHFDVGGGNALAFAPLQELNSSLEMAFAEEWVASLMELQGLKVLPIHKNNIHTAMLKLKGNPENLRSLTAFANMVQDHEIQEAIAHYTISGGMGHLLDAKQDNLSLSPFIVFEIEELMQMGDKNLIPVLTYIFHRIEKSLKGQPSLLILDEAWVMLGHPVFREKIREWLKVLRKANCAVVMATQSLSDAKKSGIFDVLAESCPTKICLANPYARQEDQYQLYKDLGLNHRQIEIISTATPKRDYYIFSPSGRRLVQLALGRETLAFIGVSDKESIKKIRVLHEQYGASDWQKQWLASK